MANFEDFGFPIDRTDVYEEKQDSIKSANGNSQPAWQVPCTVSGGNVTIGTAGTYPGEFKIGDSNAGNGRPPLTAFEQDLRRLINKHCMENHSNTPDNILAEYLVSCLDTFGRAVEQRERWYGRKLF